jgi:hypothetical protein
VPGLRAAGRREYWAVGGAVAGGPGLAAGHGAVGVTRGCCAAAARVRFLGFVVCAAMAAAWLAAVAGATERCAAGRRPGCDAGGRPGPGALW